MRETKHREEEQMQTVEGEMGGESRKEYGGSLPVENVQHLASKDLKNIPSRYLRPEVQLEEVVADASLQVPVIDFSKLQARMNQLDHDEMGKLHLACKEWGFFQLVNHGISEEIIEKMKVDTEEFFKLPLEEKMVCAQLPNGIEGYGQAFVMSEEQKLDWGDMLFLFSLPASQKKMMFWPPSPSTFGSTLDKYSGELQMVTLSLLRSMAKNLGLESDKLASLFEEGSQGVRINYYPPCPEAEQVMGITPHSDAVGLTLLLQVNQVQGLQIKKDGKWLPIEPIPGAFIVNVGDVIEIMSNGEYSSIEHRAVVNPHKERLSIAAFHNPSLSIKIGPMPDLINSDSNGAKYKTISYEEYVRLVVTSKLDGKSLMDHMKM